jgi:predicted nucleic acid-binding protein
VTAALAYLDTSAYVKVPLGEPERPALLEAVQSYALVSSWLLSVEAVRACARYGPVYAQAADAGLQTVSLLPLDDAVLTHAKTLEPAQLRTLDALHLATALSLGSDLALLVSYDERLSDAARANGLSVLTPR